MENNRIGCRSGRTKIVDPNKFDNQSSSNNVPVPLEDLNISVILQTFKKGRTVLSAGPKTSSVESTEDLTVNFINGSNINGKKVLTTNYSDLTTIFDGDSETEGLGITNISIDFNSSMSPIVVIDFIDVRGSAIFQNEANLKNGTNKYSTFFQLPYPLFELTIKGYYGKPVKYCLHLTKFNSKFNSQTGNFEITTNFIGYTFAMLSDMLIGYLKAIPYTKIGAERYAIVNNARAAVNPPLPEILNLNELMIKISNINEEIEKVSADDPDSALLGNIDNKKDILLTIENNVRALGIDLDTRGDTNENYEYIISTPINIKENKSIIDKFTKIVLPNIELFNKDNLVGLDVSAFKIPNLDSPNKNWVGIDKNNIIRSTDIGDVNLLKYINNNSKNISLLDNTKFDAWDLTGIYATINSAKNGLEVNYASAKKSLAISVQSKIREVIGFDPTVRNIIEVFTTAVEVFMETIFTVSKSAEEDVNKLREKQLAPKFKSKKNTDLKILTEIFPWPDYRESTEVGLHEAYTEKYLGATNVLTTPTDVHELNFIDDLLRAFLIAQQKVDEAINNTNKENWIPVSPVDTRLFNIGKAPYSRIEGTSKAEVIKLLLIRGMTFLGYTNSNLTGKEIDTMADSEFNDVMLNLSDDSLSTVKTSLSTLTLDDFTSVKSDVKIDDTIKKDKSIVSYDDKNEVYFYHYITYSNNEKLPNTIDNYTIGTSVIPIDSGFSSDTNWPLSDESALEFKSDYNLFLTNVNGGNPNIGSKANGGVYFKLIKPSDFNTTVSLPDTFIATTSSKFILEKLIGKIGSNPQAEAAGFNAFAGKYGIQEFENLDYGEPDLDGLPLMYVFYADGVHSPSETRLSGKYGITYNKSGLAYPRTNNDVTDYDFKDRFKFVDFNYITKNIIKSNEHDNYTKNRALFNERLKGDDKIMYPYVNQIIRAKASVISVRSEESHSLFGSRLYYGQEQSGLHYPTETPDEKYETNNIAKALLFLGTLPWNGLPFELNEIRHLFNIRGGFVHAPKLWTVYVGGLIWRHQYYEKNSVDPIRWFNSNGTSFVKQINDIIFKPPGHAYQYNKLYYDDKGDIYKKLPIELLSGDNNVFDVFIDAFLEFVNGPWETLKTNCEIIKSGSLVDFDEIIHHFYDEGRYDGDLDVLETVIRAQLPKLINYDKYKIFSPVEIGKGREFFLEFNSDAVGYNPSKEIVKLLTEEIIISNSSYRTFINDTSNTNKNLPITVNPDYFERYFNRIIKNFLPNITAQTTIKKEQEQEIFGTSNEEIIKLQLYRTCKNIYDKWLGGTTDVDNLIFQCGESGTRNNKDSELANFYRPGDKPRLIDSFRFVDRAFGDIGDKLYVNPIPVNDYLINSPNTSFYDAVGHLLTSNNFNFIALPTFINYNDDKELNAMFEPFENYDKAVEDGICGPSFVCMYVGQTSKHLDFGGSNYSNDGIDFHCNNDGNLIDVPLDYSATANEYDNDVAVFNVNYSQQNQNIFKDITLDQNEFTETDESLQVTDMIASKGTENNRTLAGQNIYNVYSVRSYKAEVEMLGNAMIQPMMHFQLNNIPMFHGGYLITRVKHNIKPNHMTTSFTGVRVRYPKTKLLDGAEFYMSMLDSLNLTNTIGGGGGSSSVSPIVQVIKRNGGVNGDFAKGNIKNPIIPILKTMGVHWDIGGDKLKILSEAQAPLIEMLNDWVTWMKSNGFKGNNGNYISVISGYRTVETQEEIKNHAPNSSAIPGTSMHGWGIAVDFNFYNKDGKLVKNYINNSKPNLTEGYNLKTNPALEWLYDHSYQYGWIIPEGLRNDFGVEEFWHFEYHGKSALCILKQRPLIKGHLCVLTNPIKPSVINPSNPGTPAKEADLSNCNYVYVGNGDGLPVSSHLFNGDLAQNQLEVKNFFKALGLTKLQTAAIMGNIHYESGYDTSSKYLEKSGHYSRGLFMFNTRYYQASDFGTTLESQLNYVLKIGYYKNWLKYDPQQSVIQLTFLFARDLERCYNCQELIPFENSDSGKGRIGFAIDTHNRFNSAGDKLFW